MGERGIVIVGAGEAGARAALSLRERGFDGPLTLLGDERHFPYERPPLSKALMRHDAEPVPTTILDEARLAAARIDHRPGTRVLSIDRAARSVTGADGFALGYETLLLSTGSRPRRLAVPGADRALYLRTFADALEMRRHLRPGARLAVIGGGFIGLEIAAGAVERGCTVAVIEVAPRILMRGVPADIAAEVERRHRDAGVAFRVGIGVERIEGGPGAMTVVLADGARIDCDAVVAGVGAIPETALAEAAGLLIENGIKVDEMLRTSDPHIFAAGDCCSFPSPLYGGRRIRLEAWHNAQGQGAAVAANMLGANVPYAAVPSFWSDQYDQTLQIVGLTDAGSRTIARRNNGGGSLTFYLAVDGRLVAATGIGPTGKVARDIRLAEMLIERRAYPDPEALAAGAPLKSMLAG